MQPHTGCINCIAVSRKTLVPFVNVSANVFDALDDFRLVMRNFAKIAIAAVTSKDSAEIGGVAIGSAALVLIVDHGLNSVGH